MKNKLLAIPAVLSAILTSSCAYFEPVVQASLSSRGAPILEVDDFEFRDLNKNGVLDPYEDWRLADADRVDDLIARMTIEEKVGAMMHGSLPGVGPFGNQSAYDVDALSPLVVDKHITSAVSRLKLAPAELAEQNNQVQEIAEAGRLGIPMTISTDPRNHFVFTFGASSNSSASMNSQWPDLLGFAALDDEALVERLGDAARQEYRAVGLHMALSPQLDVLTEPRWARSLNTFGSNADRVSRLGGAYVRGFQGSADGLAAEGVLTVVKHWVGYGAQPEGFDGHNYYGRFAKPGEAFDQHIAAFQGAFDAGAGGVMPAYPILTDTAIDGEDIEPVAAGFNAQLLQGLLRDEQGFDGIVLSDWGIINDCNERCLAPTQEARQLPPDIATPWGVEELSVRERYVKAVQAGVDQFGGSENVEPLIDAVNSGDLNEERLDQSVRRVMLAKFRMGLFDNPFVDVEAAKAVFEDESRREAAFQAQIDAQVVLKQEGESFPIPLGAKVWLFGIDAGAAERAGLVTVDQPSEAEFAIIRASTPSETLHPFHFFGSFQKEGRLDFRAGDPAFDAARLAAQYVPTALVVFMDRPAILTEIEQFSKMTIAEFGASDDAVLSVLIGQSAAKGRLPFALPRSMEAVEGQDPGVPDDSANPLYAPGYGIVSGD